MFRSSGSSSRDFFAKGSKISFILLYFLISKTALGLSNESSGWPKEIQGAAAFYQGKERVGKCDRGSAKIEVGPDLSLRRFEFEFTHCTARGRHRFADSFKWNPSEWVWKKGRGWFQGRLAGTVTSREIQLFPWVFGFRMKAKKRSGGRIELLVGFEHDNELIYEHALMTAVED